MSVTVAVGVVVGVPVGVAEKTVPLGVGEAVEVGVEVAVAVRTVEVGVDVGTTVVPVGLAVEEGVEVAVRVGAAGFPPEGATGALKLCVQAAGRQARNDKTMIRDRPAEMLFIKTPVIYRQKKDRNEINRLGMPNG